MSAQEMERKRVSFSHLRDCKKGLGGFLVFSPFSFGFCLLVYFVMVFGWLVCFCLEVIKHRNSCPRDLLDSPYVLLLETNIQKKLYSP